MEVAAPYAIKFGQALQLTDILADVGEDVDTGLVYLPADELAQDGLTAEDILARRADAPVRVVIQRLSGYARDGIVRHGRGLRCCPALGAPPWEWGRFEIKARICTSGYLACFLNSVFTLATVGPVDPLSDPTFHPER